ncbi:MAG: glycosyltransferase family 4 protein [Candidatus Doudnabacteria bacterium]|nr:glycosyltransferase family 4 protein [Candidatus Doudnabacteria bacterium]
MKIGIDARMMGSASGGIGRYVFELVKKLLVHDAINNYKIFFRPKAADSESLDFFGKFSNVELIPSNARHYSLSEQTSFLKQLNNVACDLVHFPNFNVPLYYQRPFVVTIHDMVHHKIGGAKKTHFLHFAAYKKVMESAAKNSRAIITVSESSKEDIVKYLNVVPRKVAVIYEGVSVNSQVSSEQVESVKKKFYLNKPYFLFVGVLERKKNLVSLTRAFDIFVKNYGFEMDMVLVGKQDLHYPEIKYKALDIKNRDRLVFTGAVSDGDLAALYRGAYCYVSASLHEGFGLPGVEAMSFGLPLIVSNTNVFNEIYDNAAVYFDPLNLEDIAAKMNLLVSDRQFYESLAQKSFIRSKNFDWNNTASQTLKIYKECLGENI